MPDLLNFELLKNPLNWAMIAGFVILGGLALHLIFAHHPTQDNTQ